MTSFTTSITLVFSLPQGLLPARSQREEAQRGWNGVLSQKKLINRWVKMKDYIRKDETDNNFWAWNRFWMVQCTERVDFRTKNKDALWWSLHSSGSPFNLFEITEWRLGSWQWGCVYSRLERLCVWRITGNERFRWGRYGNDQTVSYCVRELVSSSKNNPLNDVGSVFERNVCRWKNRTAVY